MIWNIRCLYGAGSLTSAERELAQYNLDLVGARVVRWNKGGMKPEDDFNYAEERNADHPLGTVFFVKNGMRSSVKRVTFVSDRITYVILRGRWNDTECACHNLGND